MTIEIERKVSPSVFDHVFGGVWVYTVTSRNPHFLHFGFRWTEKLARRRAEKVAARLLKGHIRYSYHPEV